MKEKIFDMKELLVNKKANSYKESLQKGFLSEGIE